MVARVNHFCDISEVLREKLTDFLNKIVQITHDCTEKWEGQANMQQNDMYLVSWKLPDTDISGDNEKAEQMCEQRTELADKSLIATVKVVSEMRRATQFTQFFRNRTL